MLLFRDNRAAGHMLLRKCLTFKNIYFKLSTSGKIGTNLKLDTNRKLKYLWFVIAGKQLFDVNSKC